MQLKVFTYGTLKYKKVLRILGLWELVSKISDCEVRGTLYDLGPFPALELKGNYKVKGKLLEFKERTSTLTILDRYEGAGKLFERKTIKIKSTKNPEEEVECETYVCGEELKSVLKNSPKIKEWGPREEN